MFIFGIDSDDLVCYTLIFRVTQGFPSFSLQIFVCTYFLALFSAVLNSVHLVFVPKVGQFC